MPTIPVYNERNLLQRVAESDSGAFYILYQHYFPKVYAMALSYMPDVFSAQDMVQEVFARVWVNRVDLNNIQHFEAWLITVTKNLLIKELRKAYPVGRHPESVVPDMGNELLDYRELEKLVGEAVGQLSPRQGEVYRLSRGEGCSHKEIASRLGISVDMSREHLSKALFNIRRFLLEKYGGLGAVTTLVIKMCFASFL